jgi:hypothetical protein
MAEAQSKLELIIDVQGRQLEVLTQIGNAITGLDKKIADANKNLADVVSNTDGKLTRSLSTIKSGVDLVAGSFLGWKGITGVFDFLKGSVERFAESDSKLVKLASSVKIAGGDFNALRPLITQATDRLKEFGFSETEVREGMADLINRGFSVKQALEGVGAAAKLAVLEGIPLSEGIHSISQASMGFIRPGSMLGQLLGSVRAELEKGGDQGENFEKILARLGRLDPAVEAQLGTLATRTKALSESWNEFSIDVGKFLNDELDLAGKFEGAAGFLKLLNDEMERSQRIAGGAATSNDKFDQANADLSLLIKKRTQLQASWWDRINPFSSVQNTTAGEDSQIWKMLGLGPLDNLSTDKLDKAIADVRAKLASARVAINQETVTAQKAADAQQVTHDENTAAIAQKHMQELLENSSADELRKRADLMAKLFASENADDELGYQQKLIGLKGNLAAQLALIQQHAAARLATERANATQIETLLQASSGKDIAQLQALLKSRGGEVSADQIGGFAGTGDFSGLLGAAGKSNPNFALNDHDFKDAHEKFQSLETDLVQIESLKDRLAKIGIKVDVQLAGDIKTQTDKFIQELDQEVSRKLQDLKVSSDAGGTSKQSVMTGELNLKLQEQRTLETALIAVQKQTFAAGTDGAKAQAAAVTLLQQKIAGLKPTIEQQAAVSNSWIVGFQLGLKQIADKTVTQAQLFANVMTQVAEGISNAGASAFKAWVTGSESAGKAFQDMTRSLLLAIGETIIKALILTAILELINLIPLVGPTVVSIIGAGGLASFATNLQSAKGAAQGEIINEGTHGTADDVYRRVSRGEAIIPAASVQKAGPGFIQRLIDGTADFGRMAAGGFISPEYALAGISSPVTSSSNRNGSGGIDFRPAVHITNYHLFGDTEIDRHFATTAAQRNIRDQVASQTPAIARNLERRRGRPTT